MQYFRKLLIWVLVPIVIVLAHDLYLFSQKHPLEEFFDIMQDPDIPKMSHLSDLGYLWNEYLPDSLTWSNEQLGEAQRGGFTFLLKQKTVFIFGALGGLTYVILSLFGLINIEDNKYRAASTGREHTNELLGKKSEKVDYKRK